MTWDSIDSRPIRSSRPSSRSTSFRASAGRSSPSSFSRSSSRSSPLVVLAQLPADLLELLPEEHLPLPLAQLLLDLGLDVLLGVEHADLALDVHQHPAEPLFDRQRLQQRLPLGRGDVDVAGDQVGEAARLVHPGQDLLHHLLRQAGLLAQLGGPGPGLPVQADEAGSSALSGSISSASRTMAWRYPFFSPIVDGDATALAVEQQLHARRAPAASGRCVRWSRWCTARPASTCSMFCRWETAKISCPGWPARPRWRAACPDARPRSAR